MATDSTLRPGELKDILLREIASADLTAADVSEVGTVLEVRDGIARIYVQQSVVASEMLEFTGGDPGIQQSLTRLWKDQGENLAKQHGYDFDPKLSAYMDKAAAANVPG